MRTLELDAAATVGDTVYIGGRGWRVSEIVWPDNWPAPSTLEPIETEILDAMAPYGFRLRSTVAGPATVYRGGAVYHGAATLETTGRAIVRRNGGTWLRCRIELWNMETAKTLRGLVRVD